MPSYILTDAGILCLNYANGTGHAGGQGCSCVAGDECWPEVSELARETFPEIWPQFAQQTGAANWGQISAAYLRNLESTILKFWTQNGNVEGKYRSLVFNHFHFHPSCPLCNYPDRAGPSIKRNEGPIARKLFCGKDSAPLRNMPFWIMWITFGLRIHYSEKWELTQEKPAGTFWIISQVSWCLGMPGNQIFSPKPNVPSIQNFEKLLFLL